MADVTKYLVCVHIDPQDRMVMTGPWGEFDTATDFDPDNVERSALEMLDHMIGNDDYEVEMPVIEWGGILVIRYSTWGIRG